MLPCSPSQIPTLFLLVTYRIIFQPGSSSPTLPRLILRLRFCCGSRTVLMYTISFNLTGEKTLIRRYPRIGVFLAHRLVNRLLNLFLMPLLIDLLRTRAISRGEGLVKFPLLIWLYRLCYDNRFLNLWIKDMPFQLDSLLRLPPM